MRTTSRSSCPGCCPTITGSMARPSTWTPASGATAASSTAAGSSAPCCCRSCRSSGRACTRCRCAARCRPLNTRNAALECMIRTPAGPVRFLSLHLAHIAAEERLEQIDYLLDEHRRAPSEGGPWSGVDDEPARNWSNGEPEPENPLAAIWMGDFNMEPGSAEYRRIVGSTPYHRGAAYLDGFVDAAAVASRAGGGFPHPCEDHRRQAGEAPARPLLRRRHVCGPRALGQRRYRRGRLGPFSAAGRHRSRNAARAHAGGG